jgi:branched-chain amino acid transport system ATP-binding protein
MLLSVRNLQAWYGPVQALDGVTLDVPEHGVVAVLGANGAGKSSLLRAISGILRVSAGTVEFAGQRIDRFSPERIVQLGIAQVPEGRQVFTDLTVGENLRLGAYVRRGDGVHQDLNRILSYFPILADRRRQRAGLLSGGEQQMLAIARGLMTKPKLLLLDEPSLGLAPLVVRQLFSIIRTINEKEGVAILLVEQNANLALEIAQHGYVLEVGRVALHGDAAALRENVAVREAYLGR